MSRSSNTKAAASFAAILIMGACGTESIDEVEPVGAVEILSQDDGGVTGVLAHDGVTLRFETQTHQGTDRAGAVARFLDEQDRMIAVGLFGHDLPSAWSSQHYDVATDDPARLALADAMTDLAGLALPASLEAHRLALVHVAETVPAILDLESRVETDPDANVAALEALEPAVQTAIADYYNVLAPEAMVRRAYTLTSLVLEKEDPVPYATGCGSFDRNYKQNTALGFTAFRFHQWRNWCWDTGTHVMNGPGSGGSYASSVNSAFVYDGWWVNASTWWSYPYQHYFFTQGKFRNCVVKYGCIGTYYPWVKSWVDGWGSFQVNTGK